MTAPVKAPFPWFGGKSRAAHLVWAGFGDVPNYVEPFGGSLAVLLGRPSKPRIETVNDLDCFLANFWRAVKWAPEEVAEHADWPVNEADLHARHRWLVTQDEFRRRMKREPKYFDPVIAGWWVWGLCQWIGGGWCASSNWEENAVRPRGVHTSEEARRPQLHFANGVHRRGPDLASHAKRPRLDANRGVLREISEQLPNLSGDSGAAGRGVHASGLHRRDPQRSNGSAEWEGRAGASRAPRGVHVKLSAERTAEQSKLPMIAGKSGQTGRGIQASAGTAGPLIAWMQALAERLRRVRVCCGGWKRVLGPSSTVKIGVTGVLLDPPYAAEAGRDPSLYAVESATVAHDVREWAIANGRNAKLRIALCGYDGEHEMPGDWECIAWKAGGGYAASAGNHENAHRERIWFSPSCSRVKKQLELQVAG